LCTYNVFSVAALVQVAHVLRERERETLCRYKVATFAALVAVTMKLFAEKAVCMWRASLA
jgi:hypothetical protein